MIDLKSQYEMSRKQKSEAEKIEEAEQENCEWYKQEIEKIQKVITLIRTRIFNLL